MPNHVPNILQIFNCTAAKKKKMHILFTVTYILRALFFPFSIVKRFVDEDRLPHLLFYGPPGTGKTSTILAVAKQIYSPREFNSMVLEVRNFM